MDGTVTRRVKSSPSFMGPDGLLPCSKNPPLGILNNLTSVHNYAFNLLRSCVKLASFILLKRSLTFKHFLTCCQTSNGNPVACLDDQNKDELTFCQVKTIGVTLWQANKVLKHVTVNSRVNNSSTEWWISTLKHHIQTNSEAWFWKARFQNDSKSKYIKMSALLLKSLHLTTKTTYSKQHTDRRSRVV